jgi:hypothetical protein
MAQTIEQKKQQYSRQLALHTFRQWNAARESQLQGSTGTPERDGLDGEMGAVEPPHAPQHAMEE